jgi:DNA-binding NarL/FixJ family response regulator
MKTLVVDDSPQVRARLATMIRELAGVEIVREATSAAEALALLGSFRPQIIVLDLHMPGGSGLEVLETVAAGPPPKPIVIVVTNDASEPLRSECIERGADHFLDKSTEFEQVARIVASVVRASSRAPEPEL